MELIGFLEQAFGAREKPGSRIHNDDGSIGHVELIIGDSTVMLFDAPPTWNPTPAFLRVLVDDVDIAYQRALRLEATGVTRPTELFWGDRVARIRDPLGNIWWLQGHVRDVPAGDAATRMREPAMIEAMKYVQQSLVDALAKPMAVPTRG